MLARSKYIYIAIDANERPLAAFTVKHECKTWLLKRRSFVEFPVTMILRMSDGALDFGGAYIFYVQDFLDDRKG
jgi:hypothetical protein